MYDFRLFVELPNGKRACAAFRVKSEIRTTRCLGPVDVCTDNLTAFIVGGMTVEQALRIRVDREGLVRDIALALAASVIQVLEEQDTVNGYAKEPAASKGKEES